MRHQALTKRKLNKTDGSLWGDDGEKNKAGNLFITIQYSVLYGVYGCLHVSDKEVLLALTPGLGDSSSSSDTVQGSV